MQKKAVQSAITESETSKISTFNQTALYSASTYGTNQENCVDHERAPKENNEDKE